jgi:hypothetical protein
VQEVGKALIALLTWIRRHPENRTRAPPVSGENRGAAPTLDGEYTRVLRNREARRLESLLPDDWQLRSAGIDDAADTHPLRAAFESKRLGNGGLAFEDHEGALPDAVGPEFRGRCC